jgi:hypothetical protein
MSFSNMSSARSDFADASMERGTKPAMTAPAYWNRKASNGMDRKV